MANEPGSTPVDSPMLEAGSVARATIAGTTDHVAQAVAEYARIGLDELVVQTSPLGTGQQVLDAMDLLMSEAFG